jgi:RNA polymerase sigma-70 factor (family 1)
MFQKKPLKVINFENTTLKFSDKNIGLPPILSDEKIIEFQFSESPQKGFELLFTKYYANLCNNAVRYVHSKELAEDIVAEVFANFWHNKVYEKINTSYRAYLYKAVQFRAYNCIKIEIQRNTSLEGIDFENQSASIAVLKPDEILHIHELGQKIDSAIQNLPLQAKKAFQLNRLDGLKYSEVAIELDITVSAVERLISRALSKLREDLKAEWIVQIIIAFLINKF